MATEKRLINANDIPWEEHYVPDPDSNVQWDFKKELTVAKPVVDKMTTVEAVEVEKYNALVEMYHDLRDNFIDYVCSGTCNVAPYCLNRCEGCVDRVGWCSQGSDECHGFNPAEVILDGAKMDGDGNG